MRITPPDYLLISTEGGSAPIATRVDSFAAACECPDRERCRREHADLIDQLNRDLDALGAMDRQVKALMAECQALKVERNEARGQYRTAVAEMAEVRGSRKAWRDSHARLAAAINRVRDAVDLDGDDDEGADDGR